MRRRKTPSKKGVRRAPERDRPEPPRSRAPRNLEPGRGAGRAEGPHRLYLVAARPYAARAARPRPPLGLDHRRGVPRARHRRGAGDDPARHRRDEPLPRRIGTGHRARGARRRADGQGRLAYRRRTRRPPMLRRSSCRPTRRSSTRSNGSGSTSRTTSSPTASSRAPQRSSMPVAMPGMACSPKPAASDLCAPILGSQRSALNQVGTNLISE
jgi:hypothetical protein